MWRASSLSQTQPGRFAEFGLNLTLQTERISGLTASTVRWKIPTFPGFPCCGAILALFAPAARPTTNLTAYDLYLRALAAYYPTTKRGLVEAVSLLEQAVAIDPRYGPALSWAAMCHRRLVLDGWANQPETSRQKRIDFARRALQVAREDPGVLTISAFVLFDDDIGALIGLVDRALALNPSCAQGWFRSGVLRLFAGQPDLAIEHLETALRLSPRERTGNPLTAIGFTYFCKHQFDEAASRLVLAIQHNSGSPLPYRGLAAAMPIWAGSTRRARSWQNCGRLPLRSCRP
jgi:tetratricopeptide (TPR) repeat protein